MAYSAARDIDAKMEQASETLARTDYFRSERLADEALRLARRHDDFERMHRICLPLQEARRQIRQLATDHGRVLVVERGTDVPDPVEAGVYLLQPPMIGADANRLRKHTRAARVPAMVLAREPMTDKGLWPFVAVAPRAVRVRVAPPSAVERDQSRITRDHITGPIDVSYLEDVSERLGDEAISSLEPDEHPAYLVDDLLEFLEAMPDHEKLHQRLEEACRDAMLEPVPTRPRRRPLVDDPYSF
ncbi:MAG: hypothetical protein AAGD47_13745 [Pseudomonadota bacterium]